MTRLLILLPLAVLLTVAGCSSTAQVTAPPTTTASADTTDDGPEPDFTPFDEVVTDEMTTDEGLFTLYLEDDGAKLLAAIPNEMLGREMLIVTRLAKTTDGYQYGGTKVNTQGVRWERHGDHVLLRTVRHANVADPSLPIAQAVRDSNFEPIIARLEIQTITEDSSAVVVDLTETFTTDVPVFGLPSGAREQFKVRRLDDDRSFLARAASYPRNVEVRSVLTYQAEPPENASTNTLSVEMAHSMVLLPDEEMRPRRYDPRVGFFSIQQTDYGLDAQRAERRRYITRWQLVPSDPEAYARGELVEPVEPIVYYIDPATPEQWVEPLMQGVEDWNVAFEAAGFRNAIQARLAPTDDPDWSPEDARYSVIRYLASDVQNAQGPHVHDPRTGQIIESDIRWFHNVMNLLRNWYFVQTAAVDPNARGTQFRQELMGELVRFVSAHEVGHTLGLPHNWISSNAYPVDSLRSPTFTAEHGTAPSIMDYARFNYIAQPGDGVTQLLPRVGEYDIWSVKWGYTYFPDAASEAEERERLQAMILETRGDPTLRYGAQTFDPVDPRSQNEDLGDDAVYASELGLANLKRIVPNLIAWTTEDGEPYDDLEELYGQVVGQWGRYLGHVGRNIGGVTIDTKYADEAGPVFQPVPADAQRDALRFLLEEGFTTPDWLLEADVLSRIQPAGTLGQIQRLQESALDRVLDPIRIARLSEAEWLDEANAYPAAELMSDLQAGIFAEIARGREIPVTRRVLQRAYVDRLGEIVHGEATSFPDSFIPNVYGYRPEAMDRSEALPLARGALLSLGQQLQQGIRQYTSADEQAEQFHILDLLARIEKILNPEN